MASKKISQLTDVTTLSGGETFPVVQSGETKKARVDAIAVTDAMLRDSAAVSVVGRSANTSGKPADIAASANDTVLSRESNAVGFTKVSGAMLRDSAAVSVIGRSANTGGDPADIIAALNDTMLRRTGDAVGFGQTTEGMFAANTVPDSAFKYARTAAEIAASVTPTNYQYPPLNVLRYGADPTGVDDSTTAIQAAIDVAQVGGSVGHNGNQYPINLAATAFVSSGNFVYLPKGTYRITDTLTITSSLALVGDGPAGTVIGYDGGTLTTSDYLIEVGNSPSGTDRLRPLLLQGFSLTSLDFAAHGENSPRGISLLDVHWWRIEQVNISQLYVPLFTDDAWIGDIDRCVFINNFGGATIDSDTHNLNITNTVFNQTYGVPTEQPDGAQLLIRSSDSVKIEGCDFEFANQHSILIFNDCRGINIKGNYFESANDGNSVYLWDGNSGNGSRAVVITGNFFNAGGWGISARITNASPTQHSGIVVEGNFALLDAAFYLVRNDGSSVPTKSVVRNNVVEAGLGQIDPAATGWKFDDKGTFTATYTGFTTTEEHTAVWVREGDVVVVSFPQLFSVVSNATTFTITGLPAALQLPARSDTHSAYQAILARDNSVDTIGLALLSEATSTIVLQPTATTTAWTGSGAKGVGGFQLTYNVSD